MTTLPYIATAALHAERAIMVDTCSITRDIEGVLDDVLDTMTGALTPQASDSVEVYAGKCLVSPGTTQERMNDAPGRLVASRRYGVRIPTTAAAVRPGDVVTITASDRDASLVGRRLRVESITRQSLAVTRQLVVIELDQAQ